MSDISWMVPAALQAYEKREELTSFWQSMLDGLFGERRRVVVTGAPGAGKSVLADFMSGRGYEKGYSPPGKSLDAAEVKVPLKGKRVRALVLPGQESPQKFDAITAIEAEEAPVDGVVHVMCNGFLDPRHRVTAEMARDNLPEYLRDSRTKEYEELHRVCETVRRWHQKWHTPRWMVVVCGKVDLYLDSIESARARYALGGDSVESKRLSLLQRQVGADNLAIEVVPVCTWLEDFPGPNPVVSSTVKPFERDWYVDQLARHLRGFAQGGTGA